MTLQDAEHRRHGERDPSDDNRILSFRRWCDLNGFSEATGRRIINSRKGPVITQLSARRIGITIANNARWQESRARTSA